MKPRYSLIAALAAVMAGMLGSVSCGRQAPPDQAPLQNLTSQNVVEIKNAFNASQGEVRLLLLLSPT